MDLGSVILLIVVVALVAILLRKPRGDKKRGAVRSGEPLGHIKGPGEFRFDIVGESHYQDALDAVAGPKDEDSKSHPCLAVLILEDDNPYDDKAVSVEIKGRKVGHLDRRAARQYRNEIASKGAAGLTLSVDALVVGGWDRGDGDEGRYGVKLDLPVVD